MNFYSLSANPGSTGQQYYTQFFNENNMSHSYRALRCENLETDLYRLRASGASGISISMPYKQEVIQYLDYVDPLVSEFNSCNTILIKDDKLHGFNTDYYGALYVLSLLNTGSITILGDGAMGKMFILMLGTATLISRRVGNWDQRHSIQGVVINCTPLTTPFNILPSVNVVVDLCTVPGKLKKQCQLAGVKYIAGLSFYEHQFAKQFEIYTGVHVNI